MSDGYIGVVPVPQASRVLSFTALVAASATYFVPTGYVPNCIRVSVNGLFLNTDEYTATDGVQIVFPQTLPVGTVISVEELTAFEVSTSYKKTEADLKFSQLAGGSAANFATMPQVGGSPIVESGSNANGSWTKWADGTMICLIPSAKAQAESPGNGSPTQYPNTIPATFASANYCIAANHVGTATTAAGIVSNNTQNTASTVYFGSNFTVTQLIGVYATLTGRWK